MSFVVRVTNSCSTGLHGVTSEKRILFIVAAVGTPSETNLISIFHFNILNLQVILYPSLEKYIRMF
jgi:hypothetical protein